jgi:hypothetical protein
MGIMVIGHGLLKLLNPPIDPFLYTCGSVTKVSLSKHEQAIDPQERKDECGINKHNRGRYGTPQDRLQPDANDPIASNSIQNKHTY